MRVNQLKINWPGSSNFEIEVLSFINGRLESEIGEANTHIIMPGCCKYPHWYFNGTN